MNLGLKVNFMIVLLTAAAVSLFAFYGYKEVSSTFFEITAQGELNSNRTLMNDIDHVLYERQQNILSISEEETLENYLESPTEVQYKDVNRRLSELTSLSGPWDILFVIDKDNTIVLSTDEDEVGKNIADEKESFVAVKQILEEGKSVYISDLVISPDTGKPTIIYAAPIKVDEGELVGFVVGNFSWSTIQEILKQQTSSHLHLFNKDGYFIASNQDSDNITILEKREDTFSEGHEHNEQNDGYEIRQSNEGTFRALATYSHQRGYLEYGGNKWMLVSEIPLDAILQPLNDLRNKTASVLLLIVIAALITFNRALEIGILRPLRKLTTATKEISEGKYETKILEKGNDEISELTKSFNNMIEKVKQSSQGMERKIDQRTKEVESLNDMLKILNTIMRHDIMNDITAVEGNLEIYKQHKSKKVLEEIFTVLETAIARSKGLIYKMKDLEQAMSTGNELKSTDLDKIVHKAIDDFDDDDLKITVSGNAEITADEALPSIFINLFRNSKMHGDATDISINIVESNKSVEVSIADNGVGIPNEFKSQLFKEGAKFGASGNTGLGLYVIKKTMQRYGGDVTIKDNNPSGVVFILTFPKNILNKKQIKNLLEQPGQVRGVVFLTDSNYIRNIYGQKYLDLLKVESEKLGVDLPCDDADEAGWYPIGLRTISLLLAKNVFSLSSEDIRNMGSSAPVISPTAKMFSKYLVSLKKVISKSQEIWHEHYSVGSIKILKEDEKAKKILMIVEGMKLDPTYLTYLEGYFETILRFVKPGIKASQVRIKVGKKVINGFKFEW